VTAADVNGDGKPDLIVVNFFVNTVSVLLNTTAPGATTPSFAAPQPFTASFPTAVTAADVNGDGKPDLIVANGNVNTVSVLLNTTAPGATIPSFAAQQPFTTGTFPGAVTAADVNGDGKPDLIVANSNDATVSVLLNTTAPGAATPSFAAQQTFATGAAPGAVTAADVNGDGKPDLIVANVVGNTVSVLLNITTPGAATPSFAAQQTFATGTEPRGVTAADVNGDGKPDLIVPNAVDSTVSVLLNTTAPGAATPSFAAQQTFATGTFPVGVTAADLNGDGKPDVIAANYSDSTVSVLLNTTARGAATPSFAAQQPFATGNQLYSVAAVDINGDGKRDLIGTNGSGNTVSVLLNTTPKPTTAFDANSFAAQKPFATGSLPDSVTAADVNGDGKPDLIVANHGGNTVSVLLDTTAPGAATPSFATQQPFATGSIPISVTAADVNGDGKPDPIVANANSNTVSVLLNTTAPGAATPSFAVQQTFATGSQPLAVTAADINGDGKPDLIAANFVDNTVSVLLDITAPGAATLTFTIQQPFATGSQPIAVTAADVNGDGRPDLIVANEVGNTVSVLLNTTAPGAITPGFATQQTFATGASPISVTAVDVNGDGAPDLIVANSNGATVSVLLNTTAPGATTPSFATQRTFATGSGPMSVTAADVNGDGKPDLIVANSNDNTVSLLLNTTAPGATTPSFAAQQTFATGSIPNTVTAADVNGDGQSDLIVANFGGGTVSVLLNTMYAVTASGSPATGTIHYAVPTPTATAKPTATATAKPTQTATVKPTATPTAKPTPTPTHTPVLTPTPSRTPTHTSTHTQTPTRTPTPTHTLGPTQTPSRTSTKTPTHTPTRTATATSHPTATPTPSLGLDSVTSPVKVGGSFIARGDDFNAGSMVNFFIATAKGPINAGPLKPSSFAENMLVVPVDPGITQGAGFVSLQVVNTTQGFITSNPLGALLQGSAAAGLPSLTGINGHPIAADSTDLGVALANVATVVPIGEPFLINGSGFDTVHGIKVDAFCDCPGGKVGPFLFKPGQFSATQVSLTLPVSGMNSPVIGPGSFRVSNAGTDGLYTRQSASVAAPIGAAIAVSAVTQKTGTIMVIGTGFAPSTVINFFNTQEGGVVNLGGFNKRGSPRIALTFIDSTRFSFARPAGGVAGPAYIQALNPPFVPFSSSGHGPGGAFTLK